MTTITVHQMPHGRMISSLSLAVWWTKLKKNNKVRHNIIMTQKASLLAVATVFTWLMVNNVSIYSQRREQGLIREIKLPVQELELKCSRGLCMRRGRGVFVGFYSICM